MARKEEKNPLGHLAFVIALILAIVVGAMQQISTEIASILVILGLLVGLFNVTTRESDEFMMSGVVLVIITALGSGEMTMVPQVAGILDGILMVFVPATLVVALKEVLMLGKQ